MRQASIRAQLDAAEAELRRATLLQATYEDED